MSAIFLSASIPRIDRGDYHETANPFLIQCAVRELAISVIREHTIIWGGHPAITPMLWNICEDLGTEYSNNVVLYQSKFFEGIYPEENKFFPNIVYIEAVNNNELESIQALREQMISRKDFAAAVFIGGMDGVEIEHDMFKQYHPTAVVLPVASPGGAALNLARNRNYFSDEQLTEIDFPRLYHTHLAKISGT